MPGPVLHGMEQAVLVKRGTFLRKLGLVHIDERSSWSELRRRLLSLLEAGIERAMRASSSDSALTETELSSDACASPRKQGGESESVSCE